MASFVLSFFPLDVLDEIWDLIESVSEGFLAYSCLRHSVLTYSTILPSIIKTFLMVTESCSDNEN